MALTSWWICLTVGLLATGCRGPETPSAEPAEPDPIAVTRWTDRTELFAEYPTLVVGQTSRFAIHLTRLEGFKALTDGRVEVHLQGGAAPPETFAVDSPLRPGIFGVDVTPAHAGARTMTIVLHSSGLEDQHAVGDVTVHKDAAAALAAVPAEEEVPGISFLKEQQWSLEFGTALVGEQAIRESVRVPARIEARPGGSADVVSPIDGRLARVAGLAVGSRVQRGQELARLSPPSGTPGDLPRLQQAQAEAASALAFATRDRERAERLVAAGAAPERRLAEARAAEEIARQRVTGARATLAQFDAARSGNTAESEGAFVVRAPVSGVIASRDAAVGANVTAGTILFRVVDPAQVHVVGLVAETVAARATSVTEAEIGLPGSDERIAAGRLVSVGRVLDTESRTLPITFAFDNSRLALPVGQTVSLHLLTANTTEAPVVPAAAVVDDAGRPIVFVQRGGETFERRAVTTGARAGDLVQITEGLTPGERVVTTGAYLVRLASLSTSVPAHGHVH